jgi:hypothetical protein
MPIHPWLNAPLARPSRLLDAGDLGDRIARLREHAEAAAARLDVIRARVAAIDRAREHRVPPGAGPAHGA